MGEVLRPFGDYGTPGPCEAVVSKLEELLEEAQRGELIGLAWAVVRPGGKVGYGHHPGSGSSLLLVAATSLSHEFLAKDLVENSPVEILPEGA